MRVSIYGSIRLLVVLTTVTLAISNDNAARTSKSKILDGWRRVVAANRLDVNNSENAEKSPLPEELLSKAVIRVGRIFDGVWRDLTDECAYLSVQTGRKRRKRRSLFPPTRSDYAKFLLFSKQNLPGSERAVTPRRRRPAKTIDVEIRMLKPKQIQSANKIEMDFRSSSPLFWKQKILPKRKKKKKRKRKRKRKREKGKRKRKRKKGQLYIRMKGTALESERKKISSKKLLKKTIAKQMKQKMRRMSRGPKKKLAKMKKSAKSKKYVNAIRSTVRQAEQVCKSLVRKALGRLGSLRKKVDCRFNNAHRLIRRLEKSRKISNNRKFAKAVAGVMAAVASHMRPLVDILYQQMLARRRTPVILKRLRHSVAKILRRLVRQAFGLRRAITDVIISDRKLSKQSKSTPPSSSSKTMEKLLSGISDMEEGESKKSMADTTARVISVVSQVFHSNIEDLLRVYRLRQATEKKLERGEGSCGKGISSVDCLNAQVFRVLERMAARSNSLIRNINRILPPETTAGKRTTEVPKAIKVDQRLLKVVGIASESQDDAKRKSATRVARVIIAIASNLRLVVNRLKLAVIRKKFPKERPKGKPIASPIPEPAATPEGTGSKAAAKATAAAAKAVAKVGRTVTLESLNKAMLSEMVKLEKWSGSLYQQTAKNPKEAKPKPIKVDKLSSSSAKQSAKQAATVLVAIVRRLRVIDKRVGNKLQKKLAAGETPTEMKPVASAKKKEKPDQKPLTAAKSPSPKTQSAKSKKEEVAKTPTKKPMEKTTKGKSPPPKEEKPKAKAKSKASGDDVTNHDDIAKELMSESEVLRETVRGMANEVSKAVKAGNTQPNGKSEAENVWIRFMNERLKSAGNKKKKLKQMKKFSSRLLKKATKLQRIISETVDAESEVAVMRTYRAADAAAPTMSGHSSSSSHRHRKHVHRTPYLDKVASRINKQRIAVYLGCSGVVDFVQPSSVHSVVNGIKTSRDEDSPVLRVDGLAAPAVLQGSNVDSAVEFEFKRPVALAGMWIHDQGRKHVSVITTTVYIQLTRDRGTWLPVIDTNTQKPLILSVPGRPTSLQLHYKTSVSGLRLYPQSWRQDKLPTIPHPLFITC